MFHVGLFDSGLGGLSVLKEVRQLLPAAGLLYVADSAHCPYGDRSEAEIRQRSLLIGQFLADEGALAIVVACNTATGVAVEALRANLTLPVVGMEPGVKPAAARTQSGVIGVLATGTTLAGGRFATLLSRFAAGVEVLTQPCPGLVDQVETGDLDGPATLELLARYTQPLLARGADTIVLGCTHYPFLKPALHQVCGPNITIVDTGAAVARRLCQVLGEVAISLQSGPPGSIRLLTTGDPTVVGPVAARLWQGAPPVEKANL